MSNQIASAAALSLAIAIVALLPPSLAADLGQEARERGTAKYAGRYANGRTLLEVQEGFDKAKANISQAFDAHANLPPGKIVVSFTIQPDGTVSECHVVSSTFSDVVVESAVVNEVKKVTFGARNVPPFSYPNYPILYKPPPHRRAGA